VRDKSFKPASYILLSSKTDISPNKQSEINALISDDNKNGNIVKVVLGSKTVAEGLDFKRVREVHILEPWHNLSRIEQVIGRGIRFCSHNDLDHDKRNVTIYLHAGYLKEYESIDFLNYKQSEIKAIQMGKIEKILKENAIDCYINHDINHIKQNDVTELRLKSSQLEKGGDPNIVLVKPFDKEFTKICSYMEDCNIDCNIDSKINDINDTDDSTINYDLLNDLIKKIIKFIKELFLKNEIGILNFNKIKELLNQYFEYKYDDKIIYKALYTIINDKIEIINYYGISGYLIYKKDFFVFQPLNKKKDIPLYNRRYDKRTHKKKNIKEYYKNYTKTAVAVDFQNFDLEGFNLEEFIEDKNEDIIKNFKGAIVYDKINNKNNYYEYVNNKREQIKIGSNIFFYIIDIFDKNIKELLYQKLVREYEKYKNKKDDLLYKIYNHLRLNFIYEDKGNYLILEKNNKKAPIGYFYFSEDKSEYRMYNFKKSMSFFSFKEYKKSNDKFTELLDDKKDEIYEMIYVKKPRKIDEILKSKNKLYGYGILTESSEYKLKLFNNSAIKKGVTPGIIVESDAGGQTSLENLGKLMKKLNKTVFTDPQYPQMIKKGYDIYITLYLMEKELYLRNDLYLFNINTDIIN